MTKEFKLPDLGEGIHEGEVLAVRVEVGQAVREGDIILEIETDKAAVEIPSPHSGTVFEIRVKPGDTVKVGQVLMTFSAPGEKPAAAPEPVAAGPVAATVPEPTAAATQAPGPRQGPVPASPATRRLARELGMDLAQVPPSGAAVSSLPKTCARLPRAASDGSPGACACPIGCGKRCAHCRPHLGAARFLQVGSGGARAVPVHLPSHGQADEPLLVPDPAREQPGLRGRHPARTLPPEAQERH